MAEERETEDRRANDRKERDGFSWWDLPDLVETIVWMVRGIRGLGALVVGVFRD